MATPKTHTDTLEITFAQLVHSKRENTNRLGVYLGLADDLFNYDDSRNISLFVILRHLKSPPKETP